MEANELVRQVDECMEELAVARQKGFERPVIAALLKLRQLLNEQLLFVLVDGVWELK